MYKPLNMYMKQTDKLKSLIKEYPDYPIVVACGTDVVADDTYAWWYAPSVEFCIGEILDCEQDIDNEVVFIDREEFEERVTDRMDDIYANVEMSDDAFDKIVDDEIKKYDQYWKKVILIRADV